MRRRNVLLQLVLWRLPVAWDAVREGLVRRSGESVRTRRALRFRYALRRRHLRPRSVTGAFVALAARSRDGLRVAAVRLLAVAVSRVARTEACIDQRVLELAPRCVERVRVFLHRAVGRRSARATGRRRRRRATIAPGRFDARIRETHEPDIAAATVRRAGSSLAAGAPALSDIAVASSARGRGGDEHRNDTCDAHDPCPSHDHRHSSPVIDTLHN